MSWRLCTTVGLFLLFATSAGAQTSAERRTIQVEINYTGAGTVDARIVLVPRCECNLANARRHARTLPDPMTAPSCRAPRACSPRSGEDSTTLPPVSPRGAGRSIVLSRTGARPIPSPPRALAAT